LQLAEVEYLRGYLKLRGYLNWHVQELTAEL
jgi:hypothetical protein